LTSVCGWLSQKRLVWGGQIMGAEIHAWHAREEAEKAAREADRAEALAWSLRMEGYGGPAQPSPTIGQCLHGGLGWLEVESNRCKTRVSLPLDAIRRPRDTLLLKLEASLKCRCCRKGRYAPPVHMIKLTETRATTPYVSEHPDEHINARHSPLRKLTSAPPRLPGTILNGGSR
jgi:hypothetical protein